MGWKVLSPLGNSAQILSLSYSLYLGPPVNIKNINVQTLMGNIEWDSDRCFLRTTSGVREKITIRPPIASVYSAQAGGSFRLAFLSRSPTASGKQILPA